MTSTPETRASPVTHMSYDRPVTFFALATLIPWACWFVAAWAARNDQEMLGSVLGLVGLAAPLGVVAWMTRRAPELRVDIARRLRIGPGQWRWVLLAAAAMPVAILISTAISLGFGYSPEQFLLRGGATFTAGLLPGWVVLVLAPILEEIAWHAYGTDALRTRFSVFWTSMIFIVFWALWHAPLTLIPGSSQQETAAQGWVHALNFPASMIAFVLLINWMYYRSGRNIPVTIVFHLGANLITQVLATHPDTEVMSTGLLLVVTALVLVHDRALFFTPPSKDARLSRPAR